MKLLIELPTWLGDAVMATPAIENIFHHYPNAEVSLIGSINSIQVFKYHPKVSKTFLLNRKIVSLARDIISFEEFDVFFSFRGSLRARVNKLIIPAKRKFQFNFQRYTSKHQVEKYNCFVNESLGINSIPKKLIIHKHAQKKQKKNKLLGINPGASYGSAKRWYPKKFTDVAVELSSKYEIIIFGSKSEKDFAKDIEKNLIDKSITNYQNLAGKTNLTELISKISELDLFVTGDSGPMHVAAAFEVPTVAIFGPTNHEETSQWMNKKSVIVKKNLNCQPCMKRKCPLKHHKCMKLIEASEINDEIKKII